MPLGAICRQDRQIVEPGSREASDLPYLGLEHVESQTGCILKQTETPVEDEGKSTTFRFDTRHVLYGKLRPYLNKVALPDFAGRCTTEMIPLLPAEGVDRAFLAWVLRREETIAWALRQNTGSRMPRADMDSLLTLEIPLPPLAEQERIAGRLTEQLAAVERARTAVEARLAAAEALPAALLREVFEGPEASGWERQTLGRLCTKLTDGTHRSPKNDLPPERGVPYITSKNVRRFRLDLRNVTYVSQKDHDEIFARCDPRPGDVLYTKDGAMLGLAAVNTLEYPFSLLSSVALIRPRPDVLDSEFLVAWLNAPGTYRGIVESQLGAAIQRLILDQIKNFEVPLPPLPTQRRLAAELTQTLAAAEGVIARCREELAAIEALSAALLREAFQGAN
ncbi:MAG TPA: restriction endonuclease subunit S [Phycisphaerales bacterium]